ncbi:MAG: NAD+ synthase [Rikenellaceae bacterium]|nr:NAD+ synthase [Rikenellaceae bacterium]
MKIAICQINPTVGDIAGNRDKIADNITSASLKGADLVLFGELSLSGTPLYDLASHPDFTDRCQSAISDISEQESDCMSMVGLPIRQEDDYFNSVSVLSGGQEVTRFYKAMPVSRDELPYFAGIDSPEFGDGDGQEQLPANIVVCKDVRMLIAIGDDIQYLSSLGCFASKTERPDLIIHLNAKRFARNIIEDDAESYANLARELSTSIISCGITGGSVDTIFHGGSAIFDKKGNLMLRLSNFTEGMAIVDFTPEKGFTGLDGKPLNKKPLPVAGKSATTRHTYKALVMALKDYFAKNGFKRTTIGLSGGIDSAVVAAIAVDALGYQCVTGITMPSRYSSEGSVTDSRQLAANLNITCHELPIENIYASALETLSPIFGDSPFSVAEENMQSRIRGMLLMAVANKFDTLVLNTSNKSEAAMGYGTLYGDTNGALSLLGDVYKTEVYDLAEYINRNGEVIPLSIINKAPSAELRENQKDSDTLPEYGLLDSILYRLIEENMPPMECAIECDTSIDTVVWVARMLKINEYKRWQMPPIVSVSRTTLTRDRRMPLIAKY